MNVDKLVRSLMVVLCLASVPAASYAGFWSVGISVGIPPPPIPVYAQPPVPGPGYIWTPGYWAYADEDQDYYWVPGTWVYAPAPGLLWTPGYWEAADAAYVWHDGYWGPHVGFYGGIDYGFGYFGVGFVGGYWRGGDFCYNRAVANVENVHVTNVYNNTTVVNNTTGVRPSYNGPEGVHARPTGSELAAQREPHRGWTGEQRLHAQDAKAIPALLASSNHGRPAIAATARAAAFTGSGNVATRPMPIAAAPSSGGSVADGRRSSNTSAPSDSGRYAGSRASLRDYRPAPTTASTAARGDRPAWASPSATAAAPRAPAPPARPAPSWQSNTAARLDRPAIRAASTGRAPSWQARPAYADTTARGPERQWSRAAQVPANERAWRAAPAPSARSYAPSATRQVESRMPPGHAAPSGRGETIRAAPPPRPVPVNQHRSDAKRG